MKKTLCSLVAVFAIILLFPVLAAAKADIKSVDYEGKGRIEVEFKTNVKYKKLQIKAVDEAGKTIKTELLKKDKDDVKFRVVGFPEGEKISFTISGVKKKSDKKYGSIKGSIWIATCIGGIKLKDVDYDSKDREVEFEFLEKVQWKSPKVTISNGKTEYAVRIKEKGRKDLDVKVRKLAKGSIYQYSISGIAKNGQNEYVTLTGKFMA